MARKENAMDSNDHARFGRPGLGWIVVPAGITVLMIAGLAGMLIAGAVPSNNASVGSALDVPRNTLFARQEQTTTPTVPVTTTPVITATSTLTVTGTAEATRTREATRTPEA